MSRSDNEIDALVAEKVMGWPRVHPGFSSGLPWQERIQMFVDGSHRIFTRTSNDWRPTTDVAADYTVLVKVRETWDIYKRQAFGKALDDIYHPRCWNSGKGFSALEVATQYLPGDYSRAALAAINHDTQRAGRE